MSRHLFLWLFPPLSDLADDAETSYSLSLFQTLSLVLPKLKLRILFKRNQNRPLNDSELENYCSFDDSRSACYALILTK